MATEEMDEGKLVILVSGSRYWKTDQHITILYRELSKFPKGTILVHGNQTGVDTIAKAIGIKLEFDVRDYSADWGRFGRAAGPIRNKQMLNCEKPDHVLCFHDDIEKSSGTKNMMKIAEEAGVHTVLFMI